MQESGILGLKGEEALKRNRGEVDLLLSNGKLKNCFKLEDRSAFVKSLDLRCLILLRLILEYKINYPPFVLRISKYEHRNYLKGELGIPINISIVLARSGIIIPLADEDYVATWELLNILKDKCGFLVFPKINVEG